MTTPIYSLSTNSISDMIRQTKTDSLSRGTTTGALIASQINDTWNDMSSRADPSPCSVSGRRAAAADDETETPSISNKKPDLLCSSP